jgi:CHAT domain-containing protein/tetratricopeptide (TPR) repeat protein
MYRAGVILLGAVLAQPVPLEKAPPGTPADDREALAAQAGALTAQAQALYRQGRAAEAVPLAERVLDLQRRLYPAARFPAGHRDLATALNNVGAMLWAGGDYARAEAFYRQALAMYRQLYPPARFPDGHPDVAAGLTNMGALRRARGEYAQAEPLLREAVAMYRKLYPPARFPDGHPDLARGLNNLGLLLRYRRHLGQAEAYLAEAVALYRKLYPAARFPAGHPDLADSLNNLGVLFEDRGEMARAEGLLRESLAMRRRLYPAARFPGGHPRLARGVNGLGVLLLDRGDLRGAEPLLREALALYRNVYPAERFPQGHHELAQTLNNLGDLLRDAGDPAAAEALHREALAMRQKLYPPARFPRGHPELAQSLNNVAELLLEQGRLDRAEPLIREAVAMGRRLYPPEQYPLSHPQLASSLSVLSAVLQEQGETARAEPFVREAAGTHQRLAEAFVAGASEAEALNHLAHLPLARDAYLSVARTLPGKEAAAYALVWQGKGVLARWLGRRRLAARVAGNEKTRALAAELAQVRGELAARLLDRQPGPGHAAALKKVAEQKEALEKELARRLPAFARDLGAARRSPDDLAARLPEGAAFVDLVRYVRFQYDPGRPGLAGEKRTPCYAAFVLTRGQQVRRVELGPAQAIEAAVTALTAEIRNPKLELRSASAAAVLGRLVWAPVRARLPAGTATVYLAPDLALCRVPWGALPGRREGTVLLEEHAIALVPSGQFLLEALGGPAQEPSEAGWLLAVGGVRYDRAPAAAAPGGPATRAPAAGKGLNWDYLPGSVREVDRVVTLAGKRRVRRLGDTEASTARLLRELPRARWVHLATHGFFADQHLRSVLQPSEKDYARAGRGERVGLGARSPLVLSGLVLAGANLQGEGAPADGGIVTAEAIAGLDLDGMDLAVLSACETGLGEVAGGEGVFGLQRAFHLAGCKNVVASLWQVDDEATAALMGLFYHQLWQENLPPLEALRRAQLTLYRHPERIPALARARGPDFEKAARLPATPQAAARAPARLWAGFVLSRAGR